MAASTQRLRLSMLGLVLAMLVTGCDRVLSRPELVWGKRGVQDGELVKPRAIAIDSQDRLYLVDWTARIQAFDRDGRHLGRPWTTPDYRNGRPSGLSIDPDDNLVVSDSHYHCVRVYSPEGALIRTLGGKAGTAPGEFGYVSDAVVDPEGNLYVAEFGENQRITKLGQDGRLVMCWGEPGSAPGQFARIRALALGSDGLLYVADACNHRIQVFSRDGRLIRIFGKPGTGPCEFSYPYDVALSPGRTPFLYVAEYGNHRVQKLTPTGDHVAFWGGPGRHPGQLCNPWALALDSRGRVHVLDSDNDRVQRLDF